MNGLFQDIRYALRRLRKSPGFTTVAVLTLALGIGANTAIFTVAQHMLLDRLNVPHPEQLRMFYLSNPRNGVVDEMWGWWDDLPGGGQVTTSFTHPVYEQLRSENKSLVHVMAFKNYGRMTPSDPLTFSGTALLLLVNALGAAGIPPRAAQRKSIPWWL